MKITNKPDPLIFFRATVEELILSIALFPVRYYTSGLKFAALKARDRISWYERLLGWRLTAKSLFMPLYGDYTRSGRLVGIIIRLFLLSVKSFAFVLLVALVAAVFIVYGLAPWLIIYLIFNTPDVFVSDFYG